MSFALFMASKQAALCGSGGLKKPCCERFHGLEGPTRFAIVSALLARKRAVAELRRQIIVLQSFKACYSHRGQHDSFGVDRSSVWWIVGLFFARMVEPGV